MINAMINSNYLIFIVRYLSKNTYTEFVMSDNHLFPSPDLSSIYRKSINRSKKKIREKRQNLHMDKKKIAKRQQEIVRQANRYKNIMSYSAMKYRDAMSSVKLFLTPQKLVQSHFGFFISPKPFKKDPQIFHSEKNLLQKTLLEKNIEQELPLVFIKGKISLEVNYEEGLGKLSLKKILNHSKCAFSNISCTVIATNKKIQKNSIFLTPADYQIVMAEYLNQVIECQSSTSSLEITSKWFEPKNKYLSLILKDQDTDDILFCTYCYSFRDLVEEVVKKEKTKQKIY